MKKSARAKSAAEAMSCWVGRVGTRLRDGVNVAPERGFFEHPLSSLVWSIGFLLQGAPGNEDDWEATPTTKELTTLPTGDPTADGLRQVADVILKYAEDDSHTWFMGTLLGNLADVWDAAAKKLSKKDGGNMNH